MMPSFCLQRLPSQQCVMPRQMCFVPPVSFASIKTKRGSQPYDAPPMIYHLPQRLGPLSGPSAHPLLLSLRLPQPAHYRDTADPCAQKADEAFMPAT